MDDISLPHNVRVEDILASYFTKKLENNGAESISMDTEAEKASRLKKSKKRKHRKKKKHRYKKSNPETDEDGESTDEECWVEVTASTLKDVPPIEQPTAPTPSSDMPDTTSDLYTVKPPPAINVCSVNSLSDCEQVAAKVSLVAQEPLKNDSEICGLPKSPQNQAEPLPAGDGSEVDCPKTERTISSTGVDISFSSCDHKPVAATDNDCPDKLKDTESSEKNEKDFGDAVHSEGKGVKKGSSKDHNSEKHNKSHGRHKNEDSKSTQVKETRRHNSRSCERPRSGRLHRSRSRSRQDRNRERSHRSRSYNRRRSRSRDRRPRSRSRDRLRSGSVDRRRRNHDRHRSKSHSRHRSVSRQHSRTRDRRQSNSSDRHRSRSSSKRCIRSGSRQPTHSVEERSSGKDRGRETSGDRKPAHDDLTNTELKESPSADKDSLTDHVEGNNESSVASKPVPSQLPLVDGTTEKVSVPMPIKGDEDCTTIQESGLADATRATLESVAQFPPTPFYPCPMSSLPTSSGANIAGDSQINTVPHVPEANTVVGQQELPECKLPSALEVECIPLPEQAETQDENGSTPMDLCDSDEDLSRDKSDGIEISELRCQKETSEKAMSDNIALESRSHVATLHTVQVPNVVPNEEVHLQHDDCRVENVAKFNVVSPQVCPPGEPAYMPEDTLKQSIVPLYQEGSVIAPTIMTETKAVLKDTSDELVGNFVVMGTGIDYKLGLLSTFHEEDEAPPGTEPVRLPVLEHCKGDPIAVPEETNLSLNISSGIGGNVGSSATYENKPVSETSANEPKAKSIEQENENKELETQSSRKETPEKYKGDSRRHKMSLATRSRSRSRGRRSRRSRSRIREKKSLPSRSWSREKKGRCSRSRSREKKGRRSRSRGREQKSGRSRSRGREQKSGRSRSRSRQKKSRRSRSRSREKKSRRSRSLSRGKTFTTRSTVKLRRNKSRSRSKGRRKSSKRTSHEIHQRTPSRSRSRSIVKERCSEQGKSKCKNLTCGTEEELSPTSAEMQKSKSSGWPSIEHQQVTVDCTDSLTEDFLKEKMEEDETAAESRSSVVILEKSSIKMFGMNCQDLYQVAHGSDKFTEMENTASHDVEVKTEHSVSEACFAAEKLAENLDDEDIKPVIDGASALPTTPIVSQDVEEQHYKSSKMEPAECQESSSQAEETMNQEPGSMNGRIDRSSPAKVEDTVSGLKSPKKNKKKSHGKRKKGSPKDGSNSESNSPGRVKRSKRRAPRKSRSKSQEKVQSVERQSKHRSRSRDNAGCHRGARKSRSKEKSRCSRSCSLSPKHRSRSRSLQRVTRNRGVIGHRRSRSRSLRRRSSDRMSRRRSRSGSRPQRKRSPSRPRRQSKNRSSRKPRSPIRKKSKSPVNHQGRVARASSDERIDKAQLLEAARRNVKEMMEKGTLPRGLTISVTTTKLMTQPAAAEQPKIPTSSLADLTEFCKALSKEEEKEESGEVEPKESGDEPAFKIHHPFKVKDPPPIRINIPNATQLPVKTLAEKVAEAANLHKQFPVSSGNQHRIKELEWVPVEPEPYKDDAKVEKKQKGVKAKQDDAKPPLPPLPAPPSPPPLQQAGVFNPLPMVTMAPVFRTRMEQERPPTQVCAVAPIMVVEPTPATSKPTSDGMDLSEIMSRRVEALRRLKENPMDMEAMHVFHECHKQFQAWAQSKQEPGQYTGTVDFKPLTPEELSGPFPAWVKKDQFAKAMPVFEGIGMHLLRKMGWNPGEGLGKNKEGALEPLLPNIKTDKKGLVSEEETKRQIVPAVQELGGKHPVSALTEYCIKHRLGPPEFTLANESGPDHKKTFIFKVKVNGQEYQPVERSINKKHAKAQAALVCLQHLGIVAKNFTSGESTYLHTVESGIP